MFWVLETPIGDFPSKLFYSSLGMRFLIVLTDDETQKLMDQIKTLTFFFQFEI